MAVGVAMGVAVITGWLSSSTRHLESELCFIWSIFSEEVGFEVYVWVVGGTHIAEGISSNVLTLLTALQEAWLKSQATVQGELTEGLRQFGQVQGQEASSLLKSSVQLAFPVGERMRDCGKIEQLDQPLLKLLLRLQNVCSSLSCINCVAGRGDESIMLTPL